MKKFLYTFLVLCGFCLSASAQNSSRQTNVSVQQETSFNKKMIEIQNCEELYIQLTQMFGKNFTIADPKVIAQLEKNIANKNASRCIRKKSLYGIYGEDYVNKLHLINDVNQISNQNK